jgi:dinuclear metal center YbgI/SA1388 family protein
MAKAVPLAELTRWLDEFLRVREVPDAANAFNGLQVENSGTVTHLVAAVDASQATIDGVRRGAHTAPGALLLVHHGLFWDGGLPLTGRRYLRIRSLLEQDAALYSAHIPLDLHPEVGNNAVLARQLGLTECMSFGSHKGIDIGVAGTPSADAATREALIAELARVLGIPPATIRVLPGGPARISRIGIITGGAGSAIAEAREAGCDTFVTGEGAAHTYFDAMELGVNVFYAGHYATETVGVRALSQVVAREFGLPWEFHDHPTGM